MNAAHELGEPLKVESDPFAATAGGPHFGRPLQTAFREILRQIVLQTPIVLVTGNASTGKTLLVDMTARTCGEMGLSVKRIDRGDLVHMMLGQQADVLLVDEANSVPDSELDALLTGGDKKAATTTVFLGLPSCAHRFAFSDVGSVIVELTPLPESDARNYLIERASGAGLPDLFATEALDLIVSNALGSPRLLRSLASFAFFRAASDGASQIGVAHAESALEAQSSSHAVKTVEHSIPIAHDRETPAEDGLPPKDRNPASGPSDIEKLAERILRQPINEMPAEGVDALAFEDGPLSKDENPENNPPDIEEQTEHGPGYRIVESPAVSPNGSSLAKNESPPRIQSDIEKLAERIWRHQDDEIPAGDQRNAHQPQAGSRRMRGPARMRRDSSQHLGPRKASSALRRGTLVAVAAIVVAAASVGAIVPSLLSRADGSAPAQPTIAPPPVQASAISKPAAVSPPLVPSDTKTAAASLSVTNEPQIVVAENKNAAGENTEAKEGGSGAPKEASALRGLTDEEKAAVARGIQELKKAANPIAPSDDRR